MRACKRCLSHPLKNSINTQPKKLTTLMTLINPMKKILLFGALLLSVPACFLGCSVAPLAPMPTVANVDLPHYLGRWYEVSMIPNRFQAMCESDTQANYALAHTWTGDTIQVTNRCRKTDGTLETANGVAKVIEGSHNSKLKVSFFRPFYGNYWVLALGERDTAYDWVLVGEPKREFAWILSRKPTLDAASLDVALNRAQALGYTRSQFVLSKHTHSLQ
jgi:apolipoprotein D and lipocalin family protein